MIFVQKVVLWIILAALLGCESVDIENLKRQSEPLGSQKIIDGKTTKAEIEKMFNSPRFSSFDTGLEVWKYELSDINQGVDMKRTAVDIHGTPVRNAPAFPQKRHVKNRLVIIFDENGVVKKHSYSSF